MIILPGTSVSVSAGYSGIYDNGRYYVRASVLERL